MIKNVPHRLPGAHSVLMVTAHREPTTQPQGPKLTTRERAWLPGIHWCPAPKEWRHIGDNEAETASWVLAEQPERHL